MVLDHAPGVLHIPNALSPSPSRGEGASKDSPSGRTRCSGFTLVEVLVTLGLLALVLAMAYGSLWSTVDGITRMEGRSDREQAARILLEMIDRELRSALLTTEDNRLYFLGKNGTANDQPADQLTWVQAGHLKLHPDLLETETSEVSYWLESDTDGHQVLYRREDATRDGDPAEGGETYRLSDAVIGLDFEYYGPQGWTDEWDSRLDKGLPRVVQVSLFLPAESPDPEAEPIEFRSLVDLPLAW
jgi:prepilin-type N-terminal cleavage/methylation domain-containing protein